MDLLQGIKNNNACSVLHKAISVDSVASEQISDLILARLCFPRVLAFGYHSTPMSIGKALEEDAVFVFNKRRVSVPPLDSVSRRTSCRVVRTRLCCSAAGERNEHAKDSNVMWSTLTRYTQ